MSAAARSVEAVAASGRRTTLLALCAALLVTASCGVRVSLGDIAISSGADASAEASSDFEASTDDDATTFLDGSSEADPDDAGADGTIDDDATFPFDAPFDARPSDAGSEAG